MTGLNVQRAVMVDGFAFPTRVSVRVQPVRAGLAIRILFEMRRKNGFSFTAFSDAGGVAEVSAAELLHSFDEDRKSFLMDYADLRREFSGRITATVMSNEELLAASEALETFRTCTSFAPGYEIALLAALRDGQVPEEYQLELEVT